MSLANNESEVLVSIKSFSGKGTGVMRDTLRHLSKDIKIEKVSGIYRVDRPAESFVGIRDIRRDERLDGLAMVIKGTTTLSPAETLTTLEEIEIKMQKEVLKRTLSLNLLVYGQEIIILPSLSVPHPEMHLRPEEIIPAVEVWGEFNHPVLNKTLLELSRKYVDVSWGEYLTQGSSLLAF